LGFLFIESPPPPPDDAESTEAAIEAEARTSEAPPVIARGMAQGPNETLQAPQEANAVVRPIAVAADGRVAQQDQAPPRWGFTLGIGMDAPLDSRSAPGPAFWLGARRWVAPHFIVSGVASYQQFSLSDG